MTSSFLISRSEVGNAITLITQMTRQYDNFNRKTESIRKAVNRGSEL
jgi:hypothetical protein